ncbi:hypothetical protein L3C95_09800 [Chitinophaga filiformis]|uniref:IS66 family insertion sequence element accessory protein TnpA n=1 Tax=Chitinophaga filiformis TaxID=104663 RepID=UPI001F267BE2|nr:hypothetical protein [Chitinophaga filiformis]MCF6403168.1 hypothetical protein [Chitinophaga filiformis]
MKRNKRTVEEIRCLLEQKELESIPFKEFCKINSISDATYYNWQKRVVSQSDNVTTFLPASIQKKSSGDCPFVEVEKPGGIIIRLFRQVSVEFIKSLC